MIERKSCGFSECSSPATGRGEHPWACWQHTPETEDRYPVLVTYTQQHVLWVAAEDQAEAVRYAQDTPYEKTDDQETLAEAGWTVEAPKSWDWDLIEHGDYSMPYQGREADAHVKAYQEEQYRVKRAAKTAACAAAGHPDAKPEGDGMYCPVCWRLPAPEAVAR